MNVNLLYSPGRTRLILDLLLPNSGGIGFKGPLNYSKTHITQLGIYLSTNSNYLSGQNKGDLTDPGLGLTLPLDDDDVVFDMEEGPHTDYVANANIPQQANNDLLDEGLAPLQFANEGPQETYGGLMCLNDSNGAIGTETGMCNEAVCRCTKQISALDSGTALNIPIQVQGDTAIMQDSDILPTNGFVDMMKTDWAYSKAFFPHYSYLGMVLLVETRRMVVLDLGGILRMTTRGGKRCMIESPHFQSGLTMKLGGQRE